MSPIHELARAKINLSLKVIGRRDDGYHLLKSLVVFAEIADRLTLVSGDEFDLRITGPFAAQIEGINLIDRVERLVKTVEPRLVSGQYHLEKMLPVSAGIGGGSADAAAAIRAIRTANPEFSNANIDWMKIAEAVGADVPVCLLQQAAIMEGVGEKVRPVEVAPDLSLVLVNSGERLSTAEIFHKLDARAIMSEENKEGEFAQDVGTLDGLIRHMEAIGNDLEGPALSMSPKIAVIKSMLMDCDGCVYAGLSGSGPTCFALFPQDGFAREAVDRLRADNPDWWIVSTRIA